MTRWLLISLLMLFKTEPTEKNILKAWDFCAVKARSVEIVYKDDELEEEVLARVHFNVNINVSISNSLHLVAGGTADCAFCRQKTADRFLHYPLYYNVLIVPMVSWQWAKIVLLGWVTAWEQQGVVGFFFFSTGVLNMRNSMSLKLCSMVQADTNFSFDS